MAEVKTRKRTCDYCEADLTSTDRPYTWHYALEGEFTPMRGGTYVSYDPHPKPPETTHFCGEECLARYIGDQFGDDVNYEMFDAGGKVLLESGLVGNLGNYAEQRRLATAVFKAMWAARPKQPKGIAGAEGTGGNADG